MFLVVMFAMVTSEDLGRELSNMPSYENPLSPLNAHTFHSPSRASQTLEPLEPTRMHYFMEMAPLGSCSVLRVKPDQT